MNQYGGWVFLFCWIVCGLLAARRLYNLAHKDAPPEVFTISMVSEVVYIGIICLFFGPLLYFTMLLMKLEERHGDKVLWRFKRR